MAKSIGRPQTQVKSVAGKAQPTPPHTITRGRSAINGQFVTEAYAKKHPKTTEIEHIKVP